MAGREFFQRRVALGSTAQTEDRYLRSFAPGYGCRDVPDGGELVWSMAEAGQPARKFLYRSLTERSQL